MKTIIAYLTFCADNKFPHQVLQAWKQLILGMKFHTSTWEWLTLRESIIPGIYYLYATVKGTGFDDNNRVQGMTSMFSIDIRICSIRLQNTCNNLRKLVQDQECLTSYCLLCRKDIFHFSTFFFRQNVNERHSFHNIPYAQPKDTDKKRGHTRVSTGKSMESVFRYWTLFCVHFMTSQGSLWRFTSTQHLTVAMVLLIPILNSRWLGCLNYSYSLLLFCD